MVDLLKSVHSVARVLFKKRGYEWELRRNGELKLGLWRKKFDKARAKTPPRRFVIVPGFGDTSLSWLLVLTLLSPVLRRQFDEIVLVDFPGYTGFLSAEKSFHSMDVMRSALNDVFDSLAPDTILAHSLGGWLTAHYAIECGKGQRPSVQKKHGYLGPRRLILVAPAGLHANAESRRRWEETFRQFWTLEGIDAFRGHLFAKQPAWFGLIKRAFTRFVSDEGIHQFMASVREDHLVENELGHVRASTWLIWGDRDTLVETAGFEEWLKRLGGTAHAVLLHGVGHTPQMETPAVTAAVIGQILTDRKPHARGSRWWKVVGAPAATPTSPLDPQ